MACSYATYSIHYDTLIALSTLLANYASGMTPWIMLTVHQRNQYWPMFAKDHIANLELGLGNITINREYRQTSACNIAFIFLLQYYHKGNIHRFVQY